MKKLIFYLSVCLLLLSCSNNSNQTELCDINISGYEDNTMDFASLASKVDTLYFYVGKEFASVSMIKNIYMTDSLLYVSDFNNCISLFDIGSGKLLKQLVNIGHASNEYLGIEAIAEMNDTVYILDSNSRKVLEYDKNLNYLDKVSLSFVPWDFEVTEDGFLFSKMDVAKDDNRFIHTDKKGTILNADVAASPIGQELFMCKSLIRHNSDYYLHELMSNDIYRWKEGKMTKTYTVHFSNSNENGANGKQSLFIKDYFVTTKHFICSFMYDHKQNYCIYFKEDGTIKTGSFDINSGRPFSPIFQKGDSLIGIYSTDDIKSLPNWKPQIDDCALTLFIYSF